jgi:hypothetical protein
VVFGCVLALILTAASHVAGAPGAVGHEGRDCGGRFADPAHPGQGLPGDRDLPGDGRPDLDARGDHGHLGAEPGLPRLAGSVQELKSSTYDGGTDTARSYLESDVSKFAGKHITAATMSLYNYYSATCSTSGAATQARRITSAWPSSSRPAGTDREIIRTEIWRSPPSG